MTDDREHGWSAYQEMGGDDSQDSSPSRPTRASPSQTPDHKLSRAVASQEEALDRLERYIENVVGELKQAAGTTPDEAETKKPPKPAEMPVAEAPRSADAQPVAAAPSVAPIAAQPQAQRAPEAQANSAQTRPTHAVPVIGPVRAEQQSPSPRAAEPTNGSAAPRPTTAPQGPAQAAQPAKTTAPESAPAQRATPSAPAAPAKEAARSEPPTARVEQPAAQPQAKPAQPEAKAAPEPAPSSPSPEMRVSEAPQPAANGKEKSVPVGKINIEADTGPIKVRDKLPDTNGPNGGDIDGGRGGGGGGGGGSGGVFHKRLGPVDFSAALKNGKRIVQRNLLIVMLFTLASNILVLAIPLYLFQISDRVLTSRSVDTLIMLTIVIVGAVVIQAIFDALRRFILMRTAVEVAAQLGTPILSAAARASLHGTGREYQVLGDLGQLRSFLVSGTLLSLLDAPLAPLFVLAVFLVHPHLGMIVITTSLILLVITMINQRSTEGAFSEANTHQTKANMHLDSMSRNSQIINALAMIPEAVRIWGKDTASSLRAQVIAQDRNIAFAATSKAVRLLTQVAMLGWGAHLALDGHLTGGMVIAASIIAGRALGPIEGAIEGWNQVVQSRAAYGRITSLLQSSPLNFERLNLPRPEGRLDVERLLFVPQGTKRVVLNGITFALAPGDSLAVIGNSGAGKTTLGKMLVGSILPTSGNVRLDLMDLRNWDQRQFGENIGYLPQDVQLFPASIKANIARMRDDATDAEIYQAAQLADVHEMIATLPHGYETFVAADGAPLSGGQKQRIALARAFFGNPRMVVLDEPNSNLDAAGDAALARALQHAKENKITVVTITQRPALLQSVDKILLLVNGTVALFGMRQDVLQALAQRGLSIEGGSFGHQIP